MLTNIQSKKIPGSPHFYADFRRVFTLTQLISSKSDSDLLFNFPQGIPKIRLPEAAWNNNIPVYNHNRFPSGIQSVLPSLLLLPPAASPVTEHRIFLRNS